MTLTDIILIILSIFSILGFILCLLIFLKKNSSSNAEYILNEQKKQNEYLEKTIKNLFENNSSSSKQMNDVLLSAIKEYSNMVANFLSNLSTNQNQQLDSTQKKLNDILKDNDSKLNRITDIINQNLKSLQDKNEKKLEEMRQTVDEKLSTTLEKRLGESVKIITQGLDTVSKGIGEMQSLATGVGDLKRVLTNVKTRGGWGEVQLSNLLEQILSKTQYKEQVAIKKNSSERVDFAVILPGKDDQELLLPIDAKFPLEDYSRLCQASENNDPKEIEIQLKNLENRIKEEAKSIYEKYISPPTTTDFAVLYLPVEGLYAEVIRRPALCEILQHKYKIMITGPTTLTALLSSLQMGFKTLAIEKRSSEIYNTLRTFKSEFNKFVELLSKTQKKIDEASSTLDFATKKTKTIQRRLKDVGDIEPLKIETDDTDDSDNLLDI
ncbi:MAG: DNA recombination protein RmuC [Clostridia bacterium]|nr:DNA recombination protein RmuC [Clostridia bacterium]